MLKSLSKVGLICSILFILFSTSTSAEVTSKLSNPIWTLASANKMAIENVEFKIGNTLFLTARELENNTDAYYLIGVNSTSGKISFTKRITKGELLSSNNGEIYLYNRSYDSKINSRITQMDLNGKQKWTIEVPGNGSLSVINNNLVLVLNGDGATGSNGARKTWAYKYNNKGTLVLKKQLVGFAEIRD